MSGVAPLVRRYTIPANAQAKVCTSCKAKIYWVLTEKRSSLPVNPDGASHFTSCPNASQHSKKNKPKSGDLFGGDK